ncbi:glycosyltransferase [Biformimicrobium ophioploci]|nr:glycosyltransferase [Microbulbifer sp. NKW57]
MSSLAVGVVCHDTDIAVIEACVASIYSEFKGALERGTLHSAEVLILDNSGNAQYARRLREMSAKLNARFGRKPEIRDSKNNGFGAGHNELAGLASAEFYLIANPDLKFEAGSIGAALRALSDGSIAAVMPAVVAESGGDQRLHFKKFGLLTIAARSILSTPLKMLGSRRVERARLPMTRQIYDRRTSVVFSGCCMLYRRGDFLTLGGFDEKFFLYFEDYDLSLRTLANANVLLEPEFRVSHAGGNASKKSIFHINRFVWSALRFFRRYPKYIFT